MNERELIQKTIKEGNENGFKSRIVEDLIELAVQAGYKPKVKEWQKH